MATATEPAAARAADAGTNQVLTFHVGDELFAAPILAVQEIRGWEQPVLLPQAPAHVTGVIDLRGEVVPVVDVRTRCGLPPRAPDAGTVLIVVQVATGERRSTFGLVVDGVSDVVTLDSATVQPPPSSCGERVRDLVHGIARTSERLLLLLDLAALVATERPPGPLASAGRSVVTAP